MTFVFGVNQTQAAGSPCCEIDNVLEKPGFMCFSFGNASPCCSASFIYCLSINGSFFIYVVHDLQHLFACHIFEAVQEINVIRHK